MEVISPYAGFLRGAGDTLYVSLGYRYIPKGRFSLAGTLDRAGKPALFLNCRNDWFLGGIPGFADRTAAVLRRIEQIAARENLTRLAFFGSSMGGFGSLLYGLSLGADRITVASPEIRLCTFGARSLDNLSRVDGRAGRQRLSALLQQTKGGTVRVLYGDADLSDCLNATAIAQQLPGAELFCFGGEEHHFANAINRTGELARFLFAETGREATAAIATTASHGPDHALSGAGARHLLRAAMHLDAERPAKALDAIREIASERHVPTCAHFIEGQAWMALEHYDLAADCLARAKRVNPQSVRFSKALARALLKLERPAEAAHAVAWTASTMLPDAAAAEIHAEALRLLGRHDEAAAAARRAIEIAPDRWQAHWALAECLAQTQDADGAAAAFRHAGVLYPRLALRAERRIARLQRR